MYKVNFFYFLVFFISWLVSFFIFSDLIFYEHCSIALLVLILFKFLKELSNNLSIKNLIAFIAVLQWLVGSVLGYQYNNLSVYKMVIPKEEYFGYVFPATLAMLIGLYILPSKINAVSILKEIDFENTYKKGVFLILIGFVAGLFPFLGFAGFLLSGLKYVGIFYVFFSGHARRYLWVFVVFVSLLLSSLGTGMFHDLLLWGTFFITIYFISRNSSLFFRSSVIVLGFVFLIGIQLSKVDIRAKSWSGNLTTTQKYMFGAQTLYDKITTPSRFFTDQNIAANVVRINQGWIVSHVMAYIPAQEPYAKGETIKNSIIASLFPRFMMPDKAIAGGRNNMKKYAGITLNKGTSMDISQVGEAYANFGVWGGIVFMFGLGLFLAYAIRFIEIKSRIHPELLLWMPLIFLQVVKAETSLVTILNHLVKASLLTWFFFSPWGNAFMIWLFPAKNTQANEN